MDFKGHFDNPELRTIWREQLVKTISDSDTTISHRERTALVALAYNLFQALRDEQGLMAPFEVMDILELCHRMPEESDIDYQARLLGYQTIAKGGPDLLDRCIRTARKVDPQQTQRDRNPTNEPH